MQAGEGGLHAGEAGRAHDGARVQDGRAQLAALGPAHGALGGRVQAGADVDVVVPHGRAVRGPVLDGVQHDEPAPRRAEPRAEVLDGAGEAEVPRREQQHPLGVEAADVGAPGPVPGPGVRVRRAEAVGEGGEQRREAAAARVPGRARGALGGLGAELLVGQRVVEHHHAHVLGVGYLPHPGGAAAERGARGPAARGDVRQGGRVEGERRAPEFGEDLLVHEDAGHLGRAVGGEGRLGGPRRVGLAGRDAAEAAVGRGVLGHGPERAPEPVVLGGGGGGGQQRGSGVRSGPESEGAALAPGPPVLFVVAVAVAVPAEGRAGEPLVLLAVPGAAGPGRAALLLAPLGRWVRAGGGGAGVAGGAGEAGLGAG
ncbi:hypothetical protein EG870_15790, partial [Enterococcus faecalis]